MKNKKRKSLKLNKNRFKCIDCGKKLKNRYAKRCRSCYKKIRGKNHPGYKGGKPKCPECGKEMWWSSKRCSSCWHKFNKGKNNSRWKERLRCIDCGKKLKTLSAKRCRSCFEKIQGKNHPLWKEKNKCIDCGKGIDSFNTKRCMACWSKFKVGKNNPTWKDGGNFSKCIDCESKTHNYHAKRCFSCHKKFSIGKNHNSWTGGYPKCIDCGKQLKGRKSIRCLSCRGKYFKEEKNSGWRGGSKPIRCFDCGKKIARGTKRCRVCQIRWLLKFSQSHRKNKSEKFLEKILNRILPEEYKYVGQGDFWIERYNPDFINVNGKKKIIELFGDYWHNWNKFPDVEKKDRRKLKVYKSFGYDCLVVWEKELRDINLERKILDFNRKKGISKCHELTGI